MGTQASPFVPVSDSMTHGEDKTILPRDGNMHDVYWIEQPQYPSEHHDADDHRRPVEHHHNPDPPHHNNLPWHIIGQPAGDMTKPMPLQPQPQPQPQPQLQPQPQPPSSSSLEQLANAPNSLDHSRSHVLPMTPSFGTENPAVSHSMSPPNASSYKENANESSGLTSSAIGGIIIGVLAVATLSLIFIMRRCRRRRSKPTYRGTDPFAMGFSNHHLPPVSGRGMTPVYPSTNMMQIQTPPPAPVDPSPIGIYSVISTYTPSLSDEIEILPGDQVEVYNEYDDGWCQGINLSRGHVKGVFPKRCVDFTTTSPRPDTDRADQHKSPISQHDS